MNIPHDDLQEQYTPNNTATTTTTSNNNTATTTTTTTNNNNNNNANINNNNNNNNTNTTNNNNGSNSLDRSVQTAMAPDKLYHSFKISELLQGSIRFCSNLDFTSAWEKHLYALQQAIPNYLMCDSSSDVLSYTRKPIHGMTVPQLYIKVPGVWTGGHEENIR
jgi:hypothetical protein